MVSHKKSVAPAVLGCDPHPPPSPADGDPEGGALDLSLPLSLSLLRQHSVGIDVNQNVPLMPVRSAFEMPILKSRPSPSGPRAFKGCSRLRLASIMGFKPLGSEPWCLHVFLLSGKASGPQCPRRNMRVNERAQTSTCEKKTKTRE